MKKITILILILGLLVNPAFASFGDRYFHKEQEIEIQGMPGNLAYLLSRSDAVVILELNENEYYLRWLCDVLKVVRQRKELGLELSETIFVSNSSGDYYDNNRLVEYYYARNRVGYEGLIVYPVPRIMKRGEKALCFLRASKLSPEVFKYYKKEGNGPSLKGHKVFKVTNGEEGQILWGYREELDEEPTRAKGGVNRIASRAWWYAEQKKLWGYESIEGFIHFVESYYSEEGLSAEQWASPLGVRLQKDALALVKALSEEKAPIQPAVMGEADAE